MHESANGPHGHLADDGPAGKVEPHHRVGPSPHRAVYDNRAVVPVDDPRVAGRDPADGREKGVRIDRLPVGEVVNGVEFDEWNVERGSDPPAEARLTRP